MEGGRVHKGQEPKVKKKAKWSEGCVWREGGEGREGVGTHLGRNT